MRAGRLRHQVTIQGLTTAPDAYGDIVETWTDTATVWAEVVPLSGKEYYAARQVSAEVDVRVTIRYRTGIKPAMRVKYGTSLLDIQSVIDVGGRKDELQLLCREVV